MLENEVEKNANQEVIDVDIPEEEEQPNDQTELTEEEKKEAIEQEQKEAQSDNGPGF